ncbi:MAG: sigma-70 family RNA polymerase sigma factor [Proteobacteria bacterium]|nr:sigma-70 family RNA polymerase sigma factor [Pseudomonadota bacterium]
MDVPHDLHVALLRATAERDEVAFAELYRLTSARLYGLARRLSRDTDLANEILQEAFIRVWTAAPQYDPQKGRPLHWMLGITRNISIDLIRRKATQPTADIDITEVEIPVPPADSASPDLERCIRQLNDEEARILALSVNHGLSHSELARRFAVPLGTMKSTIRRALLKLRTCLEANKPIAAAS